MPITKEDILAKIDGTLLGLSQIKGKAKEDYASPQLGEDVNGIIDLAVQLDPSKADLFPKKLKFSASFGGAPIKMMVTYKEINIFLMQIRKVVESF